jgi:hypothetical protein
MAEKIDFDTIKNDIALAKVKAIALDETVKKALEQSHKSATDGLSKLGNIFGDDLGTATGINLPSSLEGLEDVESMVGEVESSFNKFTQIKDQLSGPGAQILSSIDGDQKLSESLSEAGSSVLPVKSRLAIDGFTGKTSIADIGSDGSLEPNEVNTPRLARGVKRGTMTEEQENDKPFLMTASGRMQPWPENPYGAVYPYNKVDESESGHIQEIDDTPGAERIKESHRTGTFYEIYPNGTKVTKVVGKKFSVTVGDDYAKIEGACAIHVQGDADLFCAKDVKMMSMGDITAFAKNDVRISSGGACSVTGATDCTVGAVGTAKLSSFGETKVFSALSTELTALGDMTIQGAAAIDIMSQGMISFKDLKGAGTLGGLVVKDKALDAKNLAQDKIIATKKTSDRALKANIIRVGESPSGIPTYNFKFIRDETQSVYYGVMAQDIQESHPDAVSKDQDGYLMVDYSLIDVDYKKVS